jgi:hypothetical protein
MTHSHLHSTPPILRSLSLGFPLPSRSHPRRCRRAWLSWCWRRWQIWRSGNWVSGCAALGWSACARLHASRLASADTRLPHALHTPGAPLLHALRLEPDRWGSDRAAEAAQKQLLDMPTAERRAALCLLLSATPTWPGIDPGTAARTLVEVAELLPMCVLAVTHGSRTTQPLVLAAYRSAAALAAATQRDGSDTTPQPLHLDARQLYEAAARSAGVAVSGSSAVASTVLDLLAVCDAGQLPLEAVHLALRVLTGKLPLDRSSSGTTSTSGSSGSISGGGAEAEGEPPLDEQSVAAEAMAIANGACFFRGSLTVFLALLRRRGTIGVGNAGALQMVLAAVSEDDQGLLAELLDAVGEDGYYAMEEAAEGREATSAAIVAGVEWLARMRGHQWRLPSS